MINIFLYINSNVNHELKIINKHKKEYNTLLLTPYIMKINNNIHRFIQSKSLFDTREKVLIITDINLLNVNIIKDLIKKSKYLNKIILFTPIKWLKFMKKKSIIKHLNVINVNNTEKQIVKSDLYKCFNDIFYKDIPINILYLYYRSHKIHLPLLIHQNFHKLCNNNDFILMNYLELFNNADLLQSKIFNDKYKSLSFLYFILTIYLPLLLLKQNCNDIKKFNIKFSNVISLLSLNIINKNKKYKLLRKEGNTIYDDKIY